MRKENARPSNALRVAPTMTLCVVSVKVTAEGLEIVKPLLGPDILTPVVRPNI